MFQILMAPSIPVSMCLHELSPSGLTVAHTFAEEFPSAVKAKEEKNRIFRVKKSVRVGNYKAMIIRRWTLNSCSRLVNKSQVSC